MPGYNLTVSGVPRITFCEPRGGPDRSTEGYLPVWRVQVGKSE